MPAEAHVLVSRLQSAGIAAAVRDELTLQVDWLWSNAIGGVKVDVPDEDYEAALEIIDAKPSEPGVIVCPHCGSSDIFVRPLSVAAAVCIVLKLPIPFPLQTVDCRSCGRSHEVHRRGDSIDNGGGSGSAK